MGSSTSSIGSKNNTINAVFSSSADNATLSSQDFLNLFVAQLQNQDFNNPMDNSEMMSQITQLSNMQMMQNLAQYSKSSYAMSLVGKTVTASRYTVSGGLDTTTGMVDKVSLVDNEYVFYIDGKTYTLEQVMEVQSGVSDDNPSVNASNYSVKATDVTSSSASVSWEVPTEDSTAAKELSYTVYYSASGPFETVSQVEAGTRFGTANQKNLTNETITGLEAGSSYYVNVVVTDGNGLKSVYRPTLVLTNK